jgi:hypothetical protein
MKALAQRYSEVLEVPTHARSFVVNIKCRFGEARELIPECHIFVDPVSVLNPRQTSSLYPDKSTKTKPTRTHSYQRKEVSGEIDGYPRPLSVPDIDF